MKLVRAGSAKGTPGGNGAFNSRAMRSKDRLAAASMALKGRSSMSTDVRGGIRFNWN